MQIGSAVGVAAFGTLYLGLAPHARSADGVTAVALTVAAVTAALAAHRATWHALPLRGLGVPDVVADLEGPRGEEEAKAGHETRA